MSEYSNLSRLQEENRKVVVDLHSRLNTWEKFKKDYEDLQELLATLPQKVSHETMVPIGSVAFMPGKLVHTNEIMVLLGDNWFAERSASQAIEIVERRKKYLDASIAGIKEDLKGFDSRMKFTADVQAAAQETDGLREIKEELTPLEEERIASRGSRKAHPRAQKVGGSRKVEGLKRAGNNNTPTQKREIENLSTEELSLFARLEKLEKEEEKNVKLNEHGRETFIDKTSEKATGTVFSSEVRWTQSQEIYRHNNRQSKIGKTVTWKDDLAESEVSNVNNYSDDDDSRDDNDDDNDDDNETVRNTICVRFTTLDASAEQGKIVSKSSERLTVESPADIYSQFTHNKELKTILKPSVETEKKSEISQDRNQGGTQPDPFAIKRSEMEELISQKAFSGTVVERQSTPQSELCESKVIADANQISQSQASKKPSRFKASRQKLS